MTSHPWLAVVAPLLAASVMGGCAAPPPSARPIELRQAASDASIIHVLRPTSDAVGSRDAPILQIDGRAVAVLGFGSHAVVDLPPGRHRMALVAGAADVTDWAVTADVETKAGVTYYVAVWHQRQPQRAPEYAAPWGAAGALIFQLLNPPTGEHGARFEQVTRDVAEFAASDLRTVPPPAPATDARPR